MIDGEEEDQNEDDGDFKKRKKKEGGEAGISSSNPKFNMGKSDDCKVT